MNPAHHLTFPLIPYDDSRRASLPQPDVLRITQRDLAHAIAAAGPSSSLVSIVLGHGLTALRLLRDGIRHVTSGGAVQEAYRRMTTADFIAINGRQAWANWRTIPRNLSGRLPANRPLRVIDLCCGTGESTRVLAWWLPAGSQIMAYELDPRFAALASARTYRSRSGEVIPVHVRCCSVLEDFRDHAGARIEDGTIDVVHAIGSIGCHFTPSQTTVIIRETERVLAEGGHAFLDAGNPGTNARAMKELAVEAGLEVLGGSRSWLCDRYIQIALRKPHLVPASRQVP
jgi:SAM-dependent methyltransferase